MLPPCYELSLNPLHYQQIHLHRQLPLLLPWKQLQLPLLLPWRQLQLHPQLEHFGQACVSEAYRSFESYTPALLVHSTNFLDQVTKLSTFSNKLRSLTTPIMPGTPLNPRILTPRLSPHHTWNPDQAFCFHTGGKRSVKGEVGFAAICLTPCWYSASWEQTHLSWTKLLSANPEN